MRKVLVIGVGGIAVFVAIALGTIHVLTRGAPAAGVTAPAPQEPGSAPPLPELPPYPGPYAPPVAGPGTAPGVTVAVPVDQSGDAERPAFGTPEWEQRQREKREMMNRRRNVRRSAEDD